MHLRKYILATLLIFVLASCYREQDLDQYRTDELSNMLTLNSLVSADSTVQVAATKPYFFSDVHKGRTFVTDLDIAVSINGEEKEHMTPTDTSTSPTRKCFPARASPSAPATATRQSRQPT